MAEGIKKQLTLRRAMWLLMLLPLLMYLPGSGGFPYPRADAPYSDVAVSHYPYGLFSQRALLAEGRLPLWYPGVAGGLPLAANPLSGAMYPPGWLALLLPLPLGFNLLVLAHWLWGGLGMLRLLRAEGLADEAALWGGLAWICLPRLAAHFGAGHLTLLYALAWLPWLLAAARRRQQAQDGWRYAEAPLLALIFLADPRMAVLSGVLWAGYSLWLAGAARRLTGAAQRLASTPQASGTGWLTGLLEIGQRALLAALLAAPLALPLLELTAHSARANMSAADVLALSLPPERLLGLIFPDLGGFHEFMLYPGGVVLLLALLGGLSSLGGASRRFWGLAILAGVLLALGSALPPVAWLAQLPGMALLRVPARWLLISALALIVLAAHALDGLLRGMAPTRAARLALTALVAFALVLTVGVSVLGGQAPPPFVWGSAALLAAGVLLALAGRALRAAGGRRWAWLMALLLVSLVDWLGVGRTLAAYRPAAQVLAEGAPLAQWLAAQPQTDGPWRVYSPSYSLPQHTAAYYALQLADGVEPLAIGAYARTALAASAVPASGYSVTLPPFATGDPQHDNAAYRPDAAALGWLNVAYVASEFDLDLPDLELVQRFGATRLYRNLQARPRAWVTDGVDGWRPVTHLDWSPDAITLVAQGPGRLVLSETLYPGWQAWLDGRPVRLACEAGVWRSLELPPGTHTLELTFRPLSLALGLLMGVIALGVWLTLELRRLPAAPEGMEER